jgi:hypothetical protein
LFADDQTSFITSEDSGELQVTAEYTDKKRNQDMRQELTTQLDGDKII